jgi:hypothetical protein
MNWVTAHIQWIMRISGALTCTMFCAAIAPQAALQWTFGEAIDGPLAEIIVRNWGALVGLIGAMLLHGADRPAVRPLVLVVAGLSKLVFAGLVVALGAPYLGQAGPAIGVDLVMVALYVCHLAGRSSLRA